MNEIWQRLKKQRIRESLLRTNALKHSKGGDAK